MPKRTIAGVLQVKQIEYKNAEAVLCEFMALQEYNVDDGKPVKYSDFNLQELHDFIADKIEALDPIIWEHRWPYQNKHKMR